MGRGMRHWLTGEPDPSHMFVAADDPDSSATGDSTVTSALARIEAALRHRPTNRGCGVIVCAPDRHAMINHVLGYEIGERILAATTERVASTIRSGEAILPLSGAELVVVVPDLPAARDLTILAERIVASVAAAPVTLPDGAEHGVTVSAGLASSFDDDATAACLLRDAGRCRFHAEADGGDRLTIASGDGATRAAARFGLQQDLRAAVDEGQFVLHYQPVIEVATGRVASIEALVRWQHPLRGLLYPGTFLPELGELGLSSDLDRIVLSMACARAASAGAVGEPPTMAVNLGAGRLLDPELATWVAEALASSGLPANRLVLEIAESALRGEHDLLDAALARLDLLGVGVTLDNGSGAPAALGLLARTCRRVSYKLGRSLLLDPSPGRMRQAVAMVADVAGPGVDTVAQGVESECDRKRLRECGVRFMQGFGVQRPVPGDRLPSLLAGESARAYSDSGVESAES